MAELPFELQKLPPSALEVLRYFAVNGNEPADDIDIMDGASISERSFSKAIKRLITKKFAEMDARRLYTLTEKGKSLMRELMEYDAQNEGPAESPAAAAPALAADPDPPPSVEPQPSRQEDVMAPQTLHMTLVIPEPLFTGETSRVYVGVDEPANGAGTALILRLNTIHGDPETQEKTLNLNSGGTAHTAFQVTPGDFTQVRLRLMVFQAEEASSEIHDVGGMHVDVDVTANPNEGGQLAAFGTDVTVVPM